MDLTHEQRLTEVEARSKSNSHRIDDLEKRQDNLDELVSTVKVLAVREENVETDVKEIKTDVTSLKDIPGKRWNSVIEKIICVVAGAVATYIMTKIGF